MNVNKTCYAATIGEPHQFMKLLTRTCHGHNHGECPQPTLCDASQTSQEFQNTSRRWHTVSQTIKTILHILAFSQQRWTKTIPIFKKTGSFSVSFPSLLSKTKMKQKNTSTNTWSNSPIDVFFAARSDIFRPSRNRSRSASGSLHRGRLLREGGGAQDADASMVQA